MNKVGKLPTLFFSSNTRLKPSLRKVNAKAYYNKRGVEMDEQYFKLTIENGEEQLCRVILTFDSDDKSYVIFSQVDEDGNESVGDVSALTFELNDGDEMVNFKELETEAEWEMVNEVLATIIDEFEDVQYFTVTDENDQDLECEVIHTFDSERFDKSYVLYVPVSDVPDEEREIFAASYIAGENGEIQEIFPVETDEEWDIIEDVLAEL